MANAIRFGLSNFTLTFLIIGLFCSSVAIVRSRRPIAAPAIVEALLGYFLLFSIGASFFYNFVMHAFFGAAAARFIGWADSPFQAEVGYASLGYAVVGFLAWRRGFELRLAAILGPALFLLGAAAGHAYQMAAVGNFAPGNAGVIFYTDIFIPVIGFALLWAQHSYGPALARPTAAADPGRNG